ncbi:aldo/keto reductase [Streptococcus sp.]|uniref:aldo/keto reductase n=1 Tax=Streptococcus sp. TaxID=1306 RepID=UPI0029113DA3|nr:aldo/keto reductase [Streptococcus sp.]MDU6443859.1 aldo/keto reductase [Streptococcus sp.]MDU6639064.1 aldo/keto reductase [Streptococcus sp.]
MEYITLNNGIKMPVLGYGVYQIPNTQTKECVLEALEVGYRLIDTAQYYGNERGVGDAIKASGIPRDEIFITTKLKSNHNVERLINQSLSDLQTDYIDLLLIHWVMGNDLATWRIMENAVHSGKVHAIGLSNFYGSAYDNIVKNAEILPAVNQIEHHVLRQNKSFHKILDKTETILEAWAPFGEGKAGLFTNPVIAKIASTYGKTTAQIMLCFYLQSGIVAIPKSIHKARMIENFDIFDFKLAEDDMKAIEELNQERDLFGWY